MNKPKTETVYHYIKSSGIEFSLEEFDDNNMSRSQTHNTYELYFLMKGGRRLLLKNSFHQIKKGDIFLIAPGVMHKTLNAEPSAYRRVVINFPPKLLENLINKSQFIQKIASKDAIVVSNCEIYDSAMKDVFLLEDIAKEKGCDSAEFEIMTAAFVCRLLYHLVSGENVLGETRIHEKNSDRISEILDFVNRNYTRQITLAMLSSKFFISEFHLCRSFKKTTGRTVVEYINYLRLEKAKTLLNESDLPVGEIAKLCGFKSAVHFNHVFKEYEPTSPSKYRKIRRI